MHRWTPLQVPLLLLAAFLLPLEGSRGENVEDGAAAAVASRRVHAFFYLW